MVKHMVIRVYGQVQGVWFRQSTKEEADKLGLAGTVQNMPDGSVEIHAEGEESQLEELLSWCQSGPELSGVGSVEYQEAEPKAFSGFQII
jgi:acylphosphatase